MPSASARSCAISSCVWVRTAPTSRPAKPRGCTIKKRLKELNLAGADGPCYRTKCQCLRICTGGPICVVYPEGAWYRDVTPRMPNASFSNISSTARLSRICVSRGIRCPARKAEVFSGASSCLLERAESNRVTHEAHGIARNSVRQEVFRQGQHHRHGLSGLERHFPGRRAFQPAARPMPRRERVAGSGTGLIS